MKKNSMEQQKPEKIHTAGRLLLLLEILSRETDEHHKLTGSELLAKLRAAGYHVSPDTLRLDIRALNEYGYDVISQAGRKDPGYFTSPRPFILEQIKTLLDTVEVAGYLPKNKTAELSGNLLTLVSVYEENDLKKSTTLFNTRKHSNRDIYFNISACDGALREHSQLSFLYYDLDFSRKKCYHNNRKPYIVEPYALICLEDNYYLQALRADIEDETEARRTYRLDRMTGIKALREHASARVEKYFNTAAEYTRSVFRMFGGEEAQVTLRFPVDLCGPVYDKFGEQICITPPDTPEGEGELTETVQVSGTFFGWVAQFGGRMRITAPESVKEQYREHLRKLMQAAEG